MSVRRLFSVTAWSLYIVLAFDVSWTVVETCVGGLALLFALSFVVPLGETEGTPKPPMLNGPEWFQLLTVAAIAAGCAVITTTLDASVFEPSRATLRAVVIASLFAYAVVRVVGPLARQRWPTVST